jgi:hypothetical protein
MTVHSHRRISPHSQNLAIKFTQYWVIYTIRRFLSNEAKTSYQRANSGGSRAAEMECGGPGCRICSGRKYNQTCGGGRGPHNSHDCQRLGHSPRARGGGRGVHRRERWRTRCAPSKAGKAEALRAGRDVLAKQTQFLLDRPTAGSELEHWSRRCKPKGSSADRKRAKNPLASEAWLVNARLRLIAQTLEKVLARNRALAKHGRAKTPIVMGSPRAHLLTPTGSRRLRYWPRRSSIQPRGWLILRRPV